MKTELRNRLKKIPALLEKSISRYRVPGASLAVLHKNEILETAAGVINKNTGVKTMPGAVFQIGSVTKLLTATMVMQLVDEGRIDLDSPVKNYLPELRTGDLEALQQITTRHLLTHSSGIDGDFFQETGRGEDCIERYIEACFELGQLHPPGELFSYCNAGFIIAGRIIEKLREMPWDDALQKYIAKPVGAMSLHSLPEQALYFRAAIGHILDPKEDVYKVTEVPYLTRSNGPAGSTPFASARDLIDFSRMHLNKGLCGRGIRVLSEKAVAAMQKKRITLPEASLASAWGLGWQIFDWNGNRVIGHDGGTIGQNAYLRMLPAQNMAVVLLTNGGNTAALFRRLFSSVFEILADISLPPLPNGKSTDLDLKKYEGTFARFAARYIVKAFAKKLTIKAIDRHPVADGENEITAELLPISQSVFYWYQPGTAFKHYVTFLNFGEDGRPRYLHTGGRSTPRL